MPFFFAFAVAVAVALLLDLGRAHRFSVGETYKCAFSCFTEKDTTAQHHRFKLKLR